MFNRLLLLSCIMIYVAIGVASYALAAGSEANWSQLVTYIWSFFWPSVILLGLLYYRPLPFVAVFAAILLFWRVMPRRG